MPVIYAIKKLKPGMILKMDFMDFFYLDVFVFLLMLRCWFTTLAKDSMHLEIFGANII